MDETDPGRNEAAHADPEHADPEHADPEHADPKQADPKHADARHAALAHDADLLRALFARAADPAALKDDGRYTAPRSYGVYELPRAASHGHRYRFGNHPVREWELRREFGYCERVCLFLDRDDAETAAAALDRHNL